LVQSFRRGPRSLALGRFTLLSPIFYQDVLQLNELKRKLTLGLEALIFARLASAGVSAQKPGEIC